MEPTAAIRGRGLNCLPPYLPVDETPSGIILQCFDVKCPTDFTSVAGPTILTDTLMVARGDGLETGGGAGEVTGVACQVAVTRLQHWKHTKVGLKQLPSSSTGNTGR